MTHQPVSDLIDLSGRRALVTGGGKGIGAAIAARLTEAGAAVTIADIDPNAAEFAATIDGDFARCDITDAAQLTAAVAAGPTSRRTRPRKPRSSR